MRFQVPQFIEVEDRIFGPLTIKQFIYLAGAGGLSYALYRFLPFLLAIPLIAVAAAFGLALAFYKVNNKPFIRITEAAFKYFLGNKLYVWRKEPKPARETEKDPASEAAPIFVPQLSDSKLKDLTWSLDINEHMNPGTRETGTTKN